MLAIILLAYIACILHRCIVIGCHPWLGTPEMLKAAGKHFQRSRDVRRNLICSEKMSSQSNFMLHHFFRI